MGRLLAGGIVLTYVAQAAINIAVVTVTVPTKGIALPFISAGGTGIVLACAAMGLVGNVARQGRCPAPIPGPAAEPLPALLPEA